MKYNFSEITYLGYWNWFAEINDSTPLIKYRRWFSAPYFAINRYIGLVWKREKKIWNPTSFLCLPILNILKVDDNVEDANFSLQEVQQSSKSPSPWPGPGPGVYNIVIINIFFLLHCPYPNFEFIYLYCKTFFFGTRFIYFLHCSTITVYFLILYVPSRPPGVWSLGGVWTLRLVPDRLHQRLRQRHVQWKMERCSKLWTGIVAAALERRAASGSGMEGAANWTGILAAA